jgi:hypothetical protein
MPETDEEFSSWKASIRPLYFYDPAAAQEYAKTVGPTLVKTWACIKQGTADKLPEADMVSELGNVTAM